MIERPKTAIEQADQHETLFSSRRGGRSSLPLAVAATSAHPEISTTHAFWHPSGRSISRDGAGGAAGASRAVQMATFYQESRFVGDARPPHVYTAGHHPDGPHEFGLWVQPGAGRNLGGVPARDRRRFARRTDIDDASDFMGWYMTLTVERNGVPLTMRATSTSPITRGMRAIAGAATTPSHGFCAWPTAWRIAPRPTRCS
jgi:hypothetical protein